MAPDENEIKKAYRAWIRDEMQDPGIRREKREFIREHFEGQPLWTIRPAFAVPAFALCAVFAFLIILRPGAVNLPSPGADLVTEKSIHVASAGPADILMPHQETAAGENPSVKVKRLQSEAGPTMVYQKMDREVPLVIVWVFAGK